MKIKFAGYLEKSINLYVQSVSVCKLEETIAFECGSARPSEGNPEIIN